MFAAMPSFLLSDRYHIQHVKIFRALVLGEPERGQTQYQALCFITHLDAREFIPIESMARLRQKNPHVVRSADESRGLEQLSMDVAINLTQAWHLSAHIRNVCGEAQQAYASQADVTHWSSRGLERSMFEVQPKSPDVPAPSACSAATGLWQPCLCTYHLRLEWYPCLLKYCRGRGPSPYKCGIKSCSKSYRFSFYTPHRQLCLWDEEE
ncbi:out at first protein homolog isoform X2 [Clupea harengus]|uniref:Out at first protein homolog n=1 Tax=Clupea harengus TaxID=7950 RepID=A0A6P8FW16_CLUHA|nr:out at first protein homolog isoform X2 [Clupea harengus]